MALLITTNACLPRKSQIAKAAPKGDPIISPKNTADRLTRNDSPTIALSAGSNPVIKPQAAFKVSMATFR